MKNYLKKITATVLWATILVSGLSWVHASETRSFDALPGGTLKLKCKSGGSAHLIGWDKDVVEVSYQDSSNDLEDWDISFEETSNGITVISEIADHINSSSLSFKIMVPREYSLKFDSAGGGLTLENLKGTFKGTTAGGALVLSDVHGLAKLRSGGGQINIENCELDGRIKTGGGKVWVTDVVGDVDVSSGGGNVRFNNVRDHDGKLRGPMGSDAEGMNEGTIMIKSAGGQIDIEEAPYGAILQTGGGNIEVSSAEQFVVAKTGGGDIEVAVHNGWTKVTTGAGDIEVTYSGDGSNIEGKTVIRSGYGNITLKVPADFDLDLEIDLRFTHNSDRNYEIHSDIVLDQEPAQKMERNGGTPMKHVIAKSIRSSGHPVLIQTTNGDVVIKVID